jgi:hypothetical protein
VFLGSYSGERWVWLIAGRPLYARRRLARRTLEATSTHRPNITEEQHLELPVEELVLRARPLPAHDEMVIEDLSVEEGEAFVLAVEL